MKKKIAVVLGASLAVLLGCVITLLACGDMGGISGTVTSSFSGQPLNTNWEAWVSLWTENYSWYSQDNLSDEDWADGKYSYSNLSPDDYTVSASSYGYQSQSQDVTLSAGSSAVVNFALDPIVASIAADVVALDTVNGTETGGWRTVKVDVKYQEMCHDPRRLMVWVVGATSGTTVIYDSGENSYLDLWNCRDTSITNNPTWSGYDTVYHLAFYWDTTYFANEGYTIMAALQTNDPHGDGIDINPDPAATTWVHQAGAFPTGPTDPGTPGGSTVSVTVTNAVITAYKATSSPLPGHDQDAFLYDPNGASALSNPTFEVTVDYWESLPMEIVVWLAATAWGDTRPLPEYDPYALLEFTGPGTYTVTWDGTNPGYTGWTGEWGTWSFDVDFNVVNTVYDYVIDHFYAKTHDGQSTYYDVLVSSNHSVWWYYDETATPPGYQFRCNYALNGGSGVAPSQIDLITLKDLTVQATQTGPTALGVLHDNIQSYPSSPTLTEDDTYGTWRTVFTGQTASGAEHRRDGTNPRILATNQAVPKYEVTISEIASHPNNALAIKNEYVAQDGTVEVLKGWKTRYTASAKPVEPTNTYRWERRTHGLTPDDPWVQLGSGTSTTPMEYTENTVGDFDVRFVATISSKMYYSDARRVIVADVIVDNFALTAGGQYTKDPNNPALVHLPPVGITVSGKVSKTNDSPLTGNIKFGFIQAVEGTLDIERVGTLAWLPTAVAGDTAVYSVGIKSVFNNFGPLNDSFLGHQLYSNSVPIALGDQGMVQDLPGEIDLPIQKTVENVAGTKETATVSYEITGTLVYNCTFTAWLVVMNTGTNQYVPLKQQQFKLPIDTTGDGPWSCTPQGDPANPSSKPTDATTTSDVVRVYNFQKQPITVTK